MRSLLLAVRLAALLLPHAVAPGFDPSLLHGSQVTISSDLGSQCGFSELLGFSLTLSQQLAGYPAAHLCQPRVPVNCQCAQGHTLAKRWTRMLRDVVESPSLEALQRCGCGTEDTV